eukprot:gene11044-23087_t
MRMFGWGSSDPKEHESDQTRGSFSGYLWKMKRMKKTVVPQWTKRWYSIEGRYLRWYSSSTTEKLSGEIELASVTGVSRFEAGGKGVYSFIVYCPDRNLLLRASSAAEMKTWVRALQMQANLATGGNGMGILCKAQGQDTSVCLQKKLRSNTLESELNRKMLELDLLERSIGHSEIECTPQYEERERESGTNSKREKKNSNRSISNSDRTKERDRERHDSQIRNKQECDFDYVVGEKEKRSSGPGDSFEYPPQHGHGSRDVSRAGSGIRGSTSRSRPDPDIDEYDLESFHRDHKEEEPVPVRRLTSRSSRRDDSGTPLYTQNMESEQQKGFSTPKNLEEKSGSKYSSSRNAWI